MAKLIDDGPATAGCHLIFTHGAGAPVTSPVINHLVALLTKAGIRTTRFDFNYMAARRDGGSKRPPPRIEALTEEFRLIVHQVRAATHQDRKQKLVIGGKSMGGRIASLIADDLYGSAAIAGWFAVGYPFHPAKAPGKLRTAHLEHMQCPGLIVQGTRDALGNQTEVAGYKLSKSLRVQWCEDGDHDLMPRRASGQTHDDALAVAAKAIKGYCQSL